MDIVAVLVDGGFYQRKSQEIWGPKEPKERAKELHTYCFKHVYGVKDKPKDVEGNKDNKLYRIFYYDCPPSKKSLYHPLTKKTVNLEKSGQYKWMMGFLEEMRHLRKVALRLGKLSEAGLCYNLKYEATKKLLAGSLTIGELMEKDFVLNIEQKGVDMRIGLDISSMANKKQVTKMILISGDSDFVPVAKHARREGIDFVLDPMRGNITPELMEHIDGLKTYVPSRRGLEKTSVSSSTQIEGHAAPPA